MRFTDIFIKRPVLALVVSAFILVVGLRAMVSLPILQYPATQNAVVTVTTTYAGADSDIIAGFITTPLENAIAQANGIDYMTSTSQTGTSTITANLRLNYDSGKALTEINQGQLGPQPAAERHQQPTLTSRSARPSIPCISASRARCCPRTRSPIISSASCSRSFRRCPACRPPKSSAARTSRCASGWTPCASPPTASPRPTCRTPSTATTTSPVSATPRAGLIQINLSSATNLHSVDEYKKLIVKTSTGPSSASKTWRT